MTTAMITATPRPDTRTTSTKELGSQVRAPRILIAGLGNLLLMDDGVGIHSIYELQKAPPPGVTLAEVGVALLPALHLFEEADKVLAIDAMQAGGEPGTIYSFGPRDVAEAECQASLHELGLVAALRFLPEDQRPEVAILGVEPEKIDYGMELTPVVAAALPELVRAAREIVEGWQGGRGE
jgi:hydrogenase maturation protease